MKYCTVIGSMSRGPSIESTNHMCAERQLIRQLYRECLRKGHRPHQFSDWVHRKVYKYLSMICGQKVLSDDRIGLTNQIKFFKHDFNNFKDNYWHPHGDWGYNGLVYLNKGDDTCGTNLYKQLQDDRNQIGREHLEPWRPKERYEIIKTIKPKFNRCVLFDGGKFLHGMHIPNDMYFGEEYRFNQVFFFKNVRGFTTLSGLSAM